MARLGSFLGGVIVGGVAVYTGLKYHVVRAQDGIHLVPKLQAQFEDAYVDIRQFSFQDWNEHRGLAVAMVQADKGYLMQESATDSLRQSVDNVLQGLNFRNSTPTPPQEQRWPEMPNWRRE